MANEQVTPRLLRAVESVLNNVIVHDTQNDVATAPYSLLAELEAAFQDAALLAPSSSARSAVNDAVTYIEAMAAGLASHGSPEAKATAKQVRAVANRLRNAALPAQAESEDFGDPAGPDWQRGEIVAPEANERLCEFACCGLRLSSHHHEQTNPATCPDCAPEHQPPCPKQSRPQWEECMYDAGEFNALLRETVRLRERLEGYERAVRPADGT